MWIEQTVFWHQRRNPYPNLTKYSLKFNILWSEFIPSVVSVGILVPAQVNSASAAVRGHIFVVKTVESTCSDHKAASAPKTWFFCFCQISSEIKVVNPLIRLIRSTPTSSLTCVKVNVFWGFNISRIVCDPPSVTTIKIQKSDSDTTTSYPGSQVLTPLISCQTCKVMLLGILSADTSDSKHRPTWLVSGD